jgi:hypothetical protein
MRSCLAAIVCALGLVACGSDAPPLHPASEEHVAQSAGTCDHAQEPQAEAPVPDGPQPSAILADGARQFGAAMSDRAEVTLADIAAAPSTYDGQTVRTAGHIERVCQRMGCWMEITAEGAQPVRVPMAGHSFFLPRDVAGHEASVEGQVRLTPLTPEARAHLASEGALATADELSIEATSVVVR